MSREVIEPGISHGLDGQALVCIYRGLGGNRNWKPYAVRVKDRRIGQLPKGTYLYHVAAPGRHIVIVEGDVNVSRTFHLRKGQIHYIRVAKRRNSFLNLPKLLIVDASTGANELRTLMFSGVGDVQKRHRFCADNNAP